MKQSTLRLRSIRYKDGRAPLRVLRHDPGIDIADIARQVREALADANVSIAGFAFVAWAGDGASWGMIRTKHHSKIPGFMVPDFARNRLLAEVIETWTVETINLQRS